MKTSPSRVPGVAPFGRTNPNAIITCNGNREAIPQPDPFIAEVRDFIDAIAENRPPLAGLEDGVRNVAIMDVAWRSQSLYPVPSA